jgi:transcriptional regulator with XRE-family HTH domain
MFSFGQKLRGIRDAKPGLSLSKLAVRTRIDKHSLSLYERDKQEPPFSRIKRLCDELQIRAGYLFEEIEEFRRLRPDQVAARESLRIFLGRSRMTSDEQAQLRKLADTVLSPTTVDGWNDHLARIRAGRTKARAQREAAPPRPSPH